MPFADFFVEWGLCILAPAGFFCPVARLGTTSITRLGLIIANLVALPLLLIPGFASILLGVCIVLPFELIIEHIRND